MILPRLGAVLAALGVASAQELGPAAAVPRALGALHRCGVVAMRQGTLGRDRAWAPEVRRFADLIEREHALIDAKAADLARRRGARMGPAEVEPSEADRLASLARASGPDFDREFLAAVVESHRRALDELEEVRGSLSGEERDLLDRATPILEQHQRLASTLSAGR